MTKTRRAGGYPAIFRGKEGGDRVQGELTKRGAEALNRHRKDLQALARKHWREIEKITDADVIEYLARGKAETIAVLREG